MCAMLSQQNLYTTADSIVPIVQTCHQPKHQMEPSPVTMFKTANGMMNCFKKFVFHQNKIDYCSRPRRNSMKKNKASATSQATNHHEGSHKLVRKRSRNGSTGSFKRKGSRRSCANKSEAIEPLGKLFDEVDRLLEGVDADKQKAYQMLHDVHDKYSKSGNFLWRYAKATYNVALINGASGDTESKKQLTFKAVESVTTALDIDDKNPNSHKWYAITVGSAGNYLSTQERIKVGYKFKEHIEKAIELNPKDASAYYLLGRWCYGVYKLSWVERKLASTLFSTPPTSTMEDALKNFETAQSLQTNSGKENMLFIAKCHIEKTKYKEAADWLHKANSVPTVSIDDKNAQVEVDTLLNKYGSYHH